MIAVQLAFPNDDGSVWIPARDGDPSVRAVFDRHYSRIRYADGRSPTKFVGPGEYMVLRTAACDAIFVWKNFISRDDQEGVNCGVFRNEGVLLSSDLILEAERLAWERWPGERLFTYVNPAKVRSTNPGYCFLRAGWQRCGVTKVHRLLVLEKLPNPARPSGVPVTESGHLPVRQLPGPPPRGPGSFPGEG